LFVLSLEGLRLCAAIASGKVSFPCQDYWTFYIKKDLAWLALVPSEEMVDSYTPYNQRYYVNLFVIEHYGNSFETDNYYSFCIK